MSAKLKNYKELIIFAAIGCKKKSLIFHAMERMLPRRGKPETGIGCPPVKTGYCFIKQYPEWNRKFPPLGRVAKAYFFAGGAVLAYSMAKPA
jgi:hypothetical protein